MIGSVLFEFDHKGDNDKKAVPSLSTWDCLVNNLSRKFNIDYIAFC